MQTQIKTAEDCRLRGDVSAAMALCHDILKQSPQEPETLHVMGLIAQQLGNSKLALQFFEAALAAKPAFARAWFNRSVILRAQGRNGDALHSARAAAQLAPEIGEAWDIIGQLLKDTGNLAEAHECHARAIALQPNNPHFHGNYSLLLSAMGDLPAAYLEARKATLLDPEYPPATLGNILSALGYPEKAAEHFARARTLYAYPNELVVNEAIAYLQMGDMKRGLALWEQRQEFKSPLNVIPLWQGQKVSRLALHEEQGFGDLIQWLRYVPLLRTRVDHIEAYVRGPLRRLCEDSFPYMELLDENEPVSSAEARCRWSSFAFFFETDFHNVPPAPYLVASLERRIFWRDKLRNMPHPRIGLVWAGSKDLSDDAQRSLNIDTIYPIIACGAEHFVSIQKGRSEKVPGIFDAAPYLDDFADTAALIEELDLVISVDTSTAHLAGALGKPVFIYLRYNGDWRWLLGREDTPWYPTAHLYRQKNPQSRSDVIERIVADVRKFIAGDKTVLSPPQWEGENLRQEPNALPLPD